MQAVHRNITSSKRKIYESRSKVRNNSVWGRGTTTSVFLRPLLKHSTRWANEEPKCSFHLVLMVAPGGPSNGAAGGRMPAHYAGSSLSNLNSLNFGFFPAVLLRQILFIRFPCPPAPFQCDRPKRTQGNLLTVSTKESTCNARRCRRRVSSLGLGRS